MINIFDFLNYRILLSTYIIESKELNSNFSYQYFSNKIGIKNKGFLYNIIKGKKNISEELAIDIAKAMKLTKKETNYFKTLVLFNQAKNSSDKDIHFEKLILIKSNSKSTKVLEKEQYEMFSSWYHSVVRSIIDMYDFKNDYKWLSKMVYPEITEHRAKLSVRLLEKLGLIIRNKNGYYKLADKKISTDDEIISQAIKKFHINTLELTKNSIEEVSREERNISGLTLGISEKGYSLICEEIKNMQDKIMEIAKNDEDASRVYQLNFHLFPVSKK